jgi:hypothetical protein
MFSGRRFLMNVRCGALNQLKLSNIHWFNGSIVFNSDLRKGLSYRKSSKLSKVLKKIEVLRKEMENLGNIKGMADPEIVIVSQKLDAEINDYYQLLYNGKA